jgi:ABC-2 type transport system permease protein
MLLTIANRSWRDHWKAILAWGLGLIGIAAVQLSVYPSVRDTATSMDQFINQFPEPLKVMFRISDYTSGPGYLSVELFSLMVPLIFIAVGASWGASATAAEEENGTADLLFTLPISRASVLTARMVATVAVLIVLALALTATLAIGVQLLDMQVATERLLAASLTSALLGLLFSGVGFIIGAVTGKKGAALGVSIGIALTAYLLFSLAPLVSGLEDALPLNPFQWSVGSNAISEGWNPGYLLRLALVALALYAGSILALQRRDITS